MSKPATTTSASLPPPPVSAAKQTASTSVTTPPQPPAANGTVGGAVAQFRLPSTATVEHAMKLAINEDRPIMMDYWKDSIEKTVLIGQRDDETKEKILVRSEEEYTSPIKQILKVGTDYIIMTENSIYLVDTGIPFRRISA
jgi:hypothetical protein